METRLKPLHVAVVGAGSFGTALAVATSWRGHRTLLCGRNPEAMDQIDRERFNARYLPGIRIPDNVECTADIGAIARADLVLLAVPSHEMRLAARRAADHLGPGQIVAHATKGLEQGTNLRMSQVVSQEIPTLRPDRMAVLSGPSHAEELSRGMPTTVVVSSPARAAAEFVQDALMGPTLRIYTNPDVIGAEYAGALKNIIALGSGISDGLSFGDNAKAALITRGLVEITRLGTRLGGAFSTFSGLTGIGDLIVTCTSRHSRNWRTGNLLGHGVSLQDALRQIGMAVEGVRTTGAALELARESGIKMPIAEALGDVLFHGKPPEEAVRELMSRLPTHETEELVADTTANWEFP